MNTSTALTLTGAAVAFLLFRKKQGKVGNAELTPFGRPEYCSPITTFEWRTGDFVTARSRPFIYHRGIVVVEDGCVSIYHCTPMLQNKFGGCVVKESMAEFERTREIEHVLPTDMTKEYIEEAAMDHKGNKFNILFNNCEQFTYLLKDGKKKSPQLRKLALITAAGLIGLYVIRRNKTTEPIIN